MGIIESIILGIIQGLTEFLPVSSSAHLLMFPWIMGWSQPPFVFDTSLNIGTLIALFIYFRKDISDLIKGFIRLCLIRDIKNDFEARLSLLVLLGTIPAGIIGLVFEKDIETYFYSPYVIVFTLIFWGILLWYADKKGKKNKSIMNLTFVDAFIIGIAQSFALIPGTSRSGVTMTTALFSQFNRESAAKFSFLLSIPITTAATLYKLKDLFRMNITSDLIINFSVGVISSGVIGYLCIAYLLKFLKHNSFAVFGIYRILAGLFLLLLLPTLLQGKIEMKELNTCFINYNQEKVSREKDDHYILVNKGDKVILEPQFENISSSKIDSLELSINIESSYAKQINITQKSELELQPYKIYPEKTMKCNSISEIESMGKSFPFIIEISDKVKSGVKIPITFTMTNLSGKRVDFTQNLKVN
ncbi:MAG: undecaprenyl-diphosphatase UppP [Cyanobacteriota bacterium]